MDFTQYIPLLMGLLLLTVIVSMLIAGIRDVTESWRRRHADIEYERGILWETK